MDELQKARADWIAAQEKILDLEKRVSDLTCEKYELQAKLYSAEVRAMIAENMHKGFIAALFGLR